MSLPSWGHHILARGAGQGLLHTRNVLSRKGITSGRSVPGQGLSCHRAEVDEGLFRGPGDAHPGGADVGLRRRQGLLLTHRLRVRAPPSDPGRSSTEEQWETELCRFGTRADPTGNGQMRRTGLLLVRPSGGTRRRRSTRQSARPTGPLTGPASNKGQENNTSQRKGNDDDEVLGHQAPPVAGQPRGAGPHPAPAHAHPRRRHGLFARPRVGAVPPGRHQHGGRGHVLRARV